MIPGQAQPLGNFVAWRKCHQGLTPLPVVIECVHLNSFVEGASH